MQATQYEQHAAITRSTIDAAILEHTKQVVGDERRRADECMKEIQLSLNKYDCAIVPRCIITTNGAEFQIETVPRIHPGEKAAREAKGETFKGPYQQTGSDIKPPTPPEPPKTEAADAAQERQESQSDRKEH